MDIFSFVSIVFPLIPAALIFIKKNYRTESLNFVMMLCVLNFIRSLLLFMLQLNFAAQNIIANIFSITELIILIQIFKHSLPEKLSKFANIFLIAFLSVIVTVYLLKGIGQRIYALEGFQNMIIIFISILCLAKLVSSNNLYIFNEPLFWIATGSLFYFFISILMLVLTPQFVQLPQESLTEKEILLGIGNMAKYFFYTLGVFFYRPPYNEKENY